MKNCYNKNGYRETIQKGLNAIGSLSSNISIGKGIKEVQLKRLKNEIQNADTIIIGAGAGLSTSAGLTYSGNRFEKYFFDFAEKYGIKDIYSGGFYPFPNNETKWA